jgi:hypothetical protein
VNLGMLRTLLKQGCIHAERLGRKEVTNADIELALQLHQKTTHFPVPPPDSLATIAKEINSIPLEQAVASSVQVMRPLVSTLPQVYHFIDSPPLFSRFYFFSSYT